MKFQFQRNKYGRELLIDCGLMSELKGFTLDNTPYWIDFHEIYFVTSGEGTFKINEEQIAFKAGTVLLIPPGKWRQWEAIKGKLDGYVLMFEEDFTAKFFNDGLFLYRFHYFYNNSSPSFVQLNAEELSEYTKLLNQIKQELACLKHDSNHLLRAILYLLLISINRAYTAQFDIKEKFFQESLALQFKKALERNIRSHREVSFYTSELSVSKSHLTKILKRSFGKPPAQLIRERLIAEAKKDLLFSKNNIAEISYALNFSEPSNFNRFFKDLVGISPNEFRTKKSN